MEDMGDFVSENVGKNTVKSESLLHITVVRRAEIGVMQRAGPVIRLLQTTK